MTSAEIQATVKRADELVAAVKAARKALAAAHGVQVDE